MMNKFLLFLFCVAIFFCSCQFVFAAQSDSRLYPNFSVTTNGDQNLANQFADLLEKSRKEIAMKLLGGWYEDKNTREIIPGKCVPEKADWREPAKIEIVIDNSISKAGGNTTWGVMVDIRGHSEVTKFGAHWIGRTEQIENNVIPHEVAHMLVAEYLGGSYNIPVWANEGIAVSFGSAERRAERVKRFKERSWGVLQQGRGIAFNNLIPDTQYYNNDIQKKEDIYSLGTSLVTFLTQRQCRGFALFMKFLRAGTLEVDKINPDARIYVEPAKALPYWVNALRVVYYDDKNAPIWEDFNEVQSDWNAWVLDRSPACEAPIPGKPIKEQFKKISNSDCYSQDILVPSASLPIPPYQIPIPPEKPAVPPTPVVIDPVKSEIWVVSFCDESENCKDFTAQVKSAIQEVNDKRVVLKDNDPNKRTERFLSGILSKGYWNAERSMPHVDYVVIFGNGKALFSDHKKGYQSKQEMVANIKKALAEIK